jgi:hypothetical protein
MLMGTLLMPKTILPNWIRKLNEEDLLIREDFKEKKTVFFLTSLFDPLQK